ncbi:MAG: electron transfer flavoprotein beta subunit/FixA family protein [Bacillota bacterium]|jgi:electron transfer flavoprotein beta subunit|nr:electron transfer flavoprotein beta subunit/FixA family protein [Bacillota bacterium]
MINHIVVCIKPIPDPEYYHQITIDPVKKTIQREGIPTIINPEDRHALEEALRIREKHGGKVILTSMAPPSAQTNLLEGLAMGADEAYLLSDRRFAGADTLATSYVLAKGIEKIGGADLVITGTQTGDGATAQVSSQLGEWLCVPHLWNVMEYYIESVDEVFVKTRVENGYLEWKATLPMVIGVTREINKPRLISVMGVMKAKKKPYAVYTADDLDLDPSRIGFEGSPTQPGEVFTPDIKRSCELVKGTGEELVHTLLAKLRERGIQIESYSDGCQAGVRE